MASQSKPFHARFKSLKRQVKKRRESLADFVGVDVHGLLGACQLRSRFAHWQWI